MKIIQIIITGIASSMFVFPFEFMAIPGINTKQMLAAIGMILMLVDMAKNRDAIFSKGIIKLSLIALGVSFMGCFSAVYNNTPDFIYATYIGSMWVWLTGAYAVVRLIKMTHGKVTVRLISNYIISVCFAQCVFAIMIDRINWFKRFTDTYLQLYQNELNGMVGTKRKYGIGASLDIAGTRFSAGLVILAAMATSLKNNMSNLWVLYYILAFLLISTVGNVISRTTTVGVILALTFIILTYAFQRNSKFEEYQTVNLIKYVLLIGIPFIFIATALYHTDAEFKQDLRFGFEGFFSLFEKGEWQVSSNDRLETMYVFPDNLRTWILGDGYFASPRDTDPKFIGKIVGGYYMGTDVGFLRFIFYFGLIGLGLFSWYFIKCAEICSQDNPKYKMMFWVICLLNFIVWLKVATDIFLIFALFLAMNALNTIYDSHETEQEDENLKISAS